MTDKGFIAVAWEAPQDTPNAYTPVDGYIIEMATGVKDNFVKVAEVDGDTRNFTATGLKDGKKYNFRIRAKNSAGVSSAYDQLAKPVKATPLVGKLHARVIWNKSVLWMKRKVVKQPCVR